MVSTLDQMAGVARAAFAGYLPQLEPPAGSSAAQRSRRQLASAQQHKGQEQQQEQQQEQREQEQQPAPLPRQRANGSVPPPSPFVQPTSVQPASFEQQVQQHGHIAIEMTAGHSTQLRALRTRSPLDGPSLRQRTGSGGRPGPLQLPPVGLSDSDTAQPRDSIGSGQAVTPTAPGSAVYSPRSPRSDDSSVSRLSVYASYASRAHTFRVRRGPSRCMLEPAHEPLQRLPGTLRRSCPVLLSVQQRVGPVPHAPGPPLPRCRSLARCMRACCQMPCPRPLALCRCCS